MRESNVKNKNFLNREVVVISLIMVSFALLIGCSGSFGSLNRSQQVQEEFEANRLPMEYKYYYLGYDTYPYVIFGIEPKYEMNSEMWRTTAPDTAEFKALTEAVWEDYGYYKFGADILDPTGKKVGIIYTAVNETSIKFMANNQIMVMPNTPFLWGPGGPDDMAP
jgi:hypothetical protein